MKIIGRNKDGVLRVYDVTKAYSCIQEWAKGEYNTSVGCQSYGCSFDIGDANGGELHFLKNEDAENLVRKIATEELVDLEKEGYFLEDENDSSI